MPSSCAEIKRDNPSSASGIYSIKPNNRTISVYCHMGTLCGVRGGWTRLRKLNMTVNSTTCPSPLVLKTDSGTRLCTKNANNCQSVPIPSLGMQYSQVCGCVRGYQKSSTDVFIVRRGLTHWKGESGHTQSSLLSWAQDFCAGRKWRLHVTY